MFLCCFVLFLSDGFSSLVFVVVCLVRFSCFFLCSGRGSVPSSNGPGGLVWEAGLFLFILAGPSGCLIVLWFSRFFVYLINLLLAVTWLVFLLYTSLCVLTVEGRNRWNEQKNVHDNHYHNDQTTWHILHNAWVIMYKRVINITNTRCINMNIYYVIYKWNGIKKSMCPRLGCPKSDKSRRTIRFTFAWFLLPHATKKKCICLLQHHGQAPSAVDQASNVPKRQLFSPHYKKNKQMETIPQGKQTTTYWRNPKVHQNSNTNLLNENRHQITHPLKNRNQSKHPRQTALVKKLKPFNKLLT